MAMLNNQRVYIYSYGLARSSDFWVIQADSQEKCLVLLESSHNRVFKQTAASSQPWREPPWLSRGDLTQKNSQFLVVTSHQHMGMFSSPETSVIYMGWSLS